MFTKLTFAITVAMLCLVMSSQAYALAAAAEVKPKPVVIICEDDASSNPLYAGVMACRNPLFAEAQTR